jgi:alpha amylase-like protein
LEGRVVKQHPLLFQINTRITLEELGRSLRRPATLDDLPDALFDGLRERGFDWLWLLGVWRTGPASTAVSRSDPKLRALLGALPEPREADISGSPFAIREYEVRAEWGGRAALARVRQRLEQRGLRLLLDFVPNHVALDHAWLHEHPELLMPGTEEDLAREPLNYVRLRSGGEQRVFAYGRDPYFAGWSDTLQLNYAHAALRAAMIAQLQRIARMCDAVRCDMAMLILPDIFERTWGTRCSPSDGSPPATGSFWSEAIPAVRAERPDFTFMAEAYWDLEWRLQQEGFAFTYDKRLYDRLTAGSAAPVRAHLSADLEYQKRSVRFLENHDEPRVASVFPIEAHRAAALLTYLVPGLRFFHEGQFEGRRVQVSMHLGRRPAEAEDPEVSRFYARLLEVLARPEAHDGVFSLHPCRPAWGGNRSFEDLVAFSWTQGRRRLVVVVNYSAHQTQGYVAFDWGELRGHALLLADLVGEARYRREVEELIDGGLYLDMPPWGYHVFECTSG